MHPQEVIIDWSTAALPITAERRDDVRSLLDWVRQYPRKRDIHVYLGRSLKSQWGPTIQNTLQALGCRVTTTA